MHLAAVSECVPTWVQKLTEGYKEDPATKQLLTELAITPSNARGYTLQNGIIRFKGRVWVGNNNIAQQHILIALHDSGVGGHSGIAATYQRVKQLFAWPGIKKSVQSFVEQCTVCQQAKSEHVKAPGLLAPLPVPSQAWEIVSLDFIEGLPVSDRANAILVIIDKFTKYAHFIPIHHPFTALQIAKLYLDHVYKLHGLPKAMISDRDRVFTSQVWQELFRLTDTKLLMSSSYHPQTDGQTERLNQCLEGFLRCTVHSCPRQWSKWLSVAEHWYNTAYHSALGKTPFEVLYGYQPRHLGIKSLQLCSVPDLEQWLKERELLTRLIQQQLFRAQQRMKNQADKNRTERTFEVGDKVYLKLQPHIRSSIAYRSNQKLAFKYFGPFEILQCIGTVAYKLDLPPEAKIHPVVHVSQLKKHVPPTVTASDNLSTVCTDPMSALSPETFLDSRLVSRGSSTVKQYLVQWSALPPSMATWEEATDLKRRYPKASA